MPFIHTVIDEPIIVHIRIDYDRQTKDGKYIDVPYLALPQGYDTEKHITDLNEFAIIAFLQDYRYDDLADGRVVIHVPAGELKIKSKPKWQRKMVEKTIDLPAVDIWIPNSVANVLYHDFGVRF